MDKPAERTILKRPCPVCNNEGLELFDLALAEVQDESGFPRSISWTLARCVSCSARLYRHSKKRRGKWQQLNEVQWNQRLAELELRTNPKAREAE